MKKEILIQHRDSKKDQLDSFHMRYKYIDIYSLKDVKKAEKSFSFTLKRNFDSRKIDELFNQLFLKQGEYIEHAYNLFLNDGREPDHIRYFENNIYIVDKDGYDMCRIDTVFDEHKITIFLTL